MTDTTTVTVAVKVKSPMGAPAESTLDVTMTVRVPADAASPPGLAARYALQLVFESLRGQ